MIENKQKFNDLNVSFKPCVLKKVQLVGSSYGPVLNGIYITGLDSIFSVIAVSHNNKPFSFNKSLNFFIALIGSLK